MPPELPYNNKYAAAGRTMPDNRVALYGRQILEVGPGKREGVPQPQRTDLVARPHPRGLAVVTRASGRASRSLSAWACPTGS